MKTGSIPVYSRRSSSSTATHSLERNANYIVNHSNIPHSGASKLRDRSVPRSVAMDYNSTEKVNLTLPAQLFSSDESSTSQSQIPCNVSKLQTPKSEHRSKLARPKTSTTKQKKDVLELTSKLPTHSLNSTSKQTDSSSQIAFPFSRTSSNLSVGKENCDSAPKLKVEALNDKNVLVSTLERNNSNTSINSCGFKSRLVKPSTAGGSSKPSGIARPRASSKLSRPSSPESVNHSFEDVLGHKTARHQMQSTQSGAKKKFGSTEGILSPNKESKTLNAMKALMTDVENHFKLKDDDLCKESLKTKEKNKSLNLEEEKASCEINKNEKQQNFHNKTTDNRTTSMSPAVAGRGDASTVSKMPRLVSQIPKSRLPSLCPNNRTPRQPRQNASAENLLENEVFDKERTTSIEVGNENGVDDKIVESRSSEGVEGLEDCGFKAEISPSISDGRLSAFDIKPMPLVMSSPYFHLSNLSATPTFPHNSQNPRLFSVDQSNFHDKSSLNSYRLPGCTTFSAASSIHKSKSNLSNSFDQEFVEMEPGYMSDGDLLSGRKTQASSGYTSDGGTSFHSGGKQLECSKLKISDDNYDNFCDENFDVCSSMSSGEDTHSINSAFAGGKLLPSDKTRGFLKSNRADADYENFERAARIRSTMPVKGRRAILPLAGFVKKTQEQTVGAASDLEEAEIDIRVTFENKLNKLKKCSTPSDSIINEGMIELDQVLNECNSDVPQMNSTPVNGLLQFPSTVSSEPNDFKFGPTSHSSNFSLMSQYSLGEVKSAYNNNNNNRKDGVSGSKFGMSLEQCYNSGVFRRQSRSSNATVEDEGSTSERSERSQTCSKTLSVASDGDQATSFGGRLLSTSKVNPYATMSRSHVASRTAERAEGLSKVEAGSIGESSNFLTPAGSRKSENSLCRSEDSTSVASLPCFKLRLHNQLPGYKTLSSSSPVPPSQCIPDGSVFDRRVYSPSGYMLSRSGSQHASGFGSSRPPSTNGNGSTLSLGSCSSLYSTAEEHHAQEIRRLRHELETAHSRVASLNMQLNINESVVQAFEQSISNLNHRLQQLSLFAPEKDPDAKELKSSLDQFSAFDKSSINFNQSSIPEDCTSLASINQHQELEKKKRQKKWLMSFGKAFFRKKNKMSHLENMRNNLVLETSVADGSHDSSLVRDVGHDPIIVLEQKLHEKEMKLTDVQLEALSSAHQLDQLRDSMAQMEKEVMYLRMDNSRLKQLMSQKDPSQSPQQSDRPIPDRPSSPARENNRNSISLLNSPDIPSKNSKHRKITLSVQLTHTNHSSHLSTPEIKSTEIMFGKLYLTENMGWEAMNRSVVKKFQNYLNNVDPDDGLGLDHTSIHTMQIGDLTWQLEASHPPMTPSSYLIGFNKSVTLTLKGVNEDRLDSLAFETMIPRSVLERYVSLMMEFRRVIFCGPSGTGKTYLALKLAQYMSDRLHKDQVTPTMSVFNVDHKSSKELRQYLSNISSNSCPQNNVIVLDNLHHVVSLADVFNGFISIGNQNSPYVIGTMNQVSSSATNLQLHHVFRWVLYSNHIKPVCGFLGRFLRRHLVERKVLGGEGQTAGELDVECEEELKKTIDWIPKVWQHVNRLLETHNSSEITLGPQLYLSCPMGGSLMRVWFTDLWNYSIFPYLMEAIKDGIQTYGCRAAWEDPTKWVEETCPWPADRSQLLHLRPEDVGYDTQQQSSDGMPQSFHSNNSNNNNNNLDSMPNNQSSCKVSSDPLLNMLLKMQEFSNNTKENIISNRDRL